MDFSVNPVGIAFVAFGRPHLVALGLVALANLGLLPLARLADSVPRRAVQLGLAAVILTAFTAHIT